MNCKKGDIATIASPYPDAEHSNLGLLVEVSHYDPGESTKYGEWYWDCILMGHIRFYCCPRHGDVVYKPGDCGPIPDRVLRRLPGKREVGKFDVSEQWRESRYTLRALTTKE